MHVPKQAEFLRAYLKKTDESWKTLAISGWMKTKQPVFFYDGSLWRYSESGIVFGYVIGRELEMVTIGDKSAKRRGRGERVKAKMDTGL